MASSNHSDPPEPTTYSKMSVGDVEAIGAHCQMAYCHQLDFLPFRCESCKGKFCLDHRTETSHDCPAAGAWARARREAQLSSTPSAPKPTILTHDQQCAHPSCKTLINTPLTQAIHCPSCSRDYCLRHRLGENHDCATLPRPKKSDGGVADALGKLRAWGAAKRAGQPSRPSPAATATAPLARPHPEAPTPSHMPKLQRIISPFTAARSSSASKAAVQLNALKRTAKGDAKTLADARLYVHLEAVADGEGASGAKVPRADAFYSRDWSVGKVLDAAAKTLSVTNVNNRGGGEEDKLRVFHVDGGKLLPFGDKLGKDVKSGDTLVLLRGVGGADG